MKISSKLSESQRNKVLFAERRITTHTNRSFTSWTHELRFGLVLVRRSVLKPCSSARSSALRPNERFERDKPASPVLPRDLVLGGSEMNGQILG